MNCTRDTFSDATLCGAGEHEQGGGADREHGACKPPAPATEQCDGRGGAECDQRSHRHE